MSGLTFAANVTFPGTMNLEAVESPAPGDDVTVNPGVTVESTGGSLTLSAGDNVVLQASSLVQSDVGAVTLAAGVNDSDSSGDISLAGSVSAPSTVMLTANLAGAQITQTAGTITAATLTGSAGASATLTSLGNTIGSLNGFTTTSGFALVDGAGGLTVDGAVTGGSGLASISTTGGALDVNSTVGGANVTLASTNNNITLDGAVSTAGTLTLNSGGSSTQTAALSAGTLAGTASSATLTNAGNTIGSLNGFTTTSGFALVDSAGGLTVDGAVTGGSGLASISTTGGVLDVNSTVSGANVTLTSTDSAITLDAAVSTAGALTLNAAAATTFNVALSSVGSVATDAAGTTVVNGGSVTTTGAQTYHDAVTLGADTAFTSTGGGNLTFDSTVDAAFDLSVDTAGSTTFTGAISGAGEFHQDGTGTTTLGAINTFTGDTNVNDGTLRVNGSLASAVTVNDGGTLGGTGSVSNSVTIADGGTLAPGSSAGTTTVGALNLDPSAVLAYELDTPNVVGGGVNDLTVVNGNLVLDGTLDVTDLGDFGLGTYRLFNYTGTLTDNTLEVGTLPGPFNAVIDTSTPNQVKLLVLEDDSLVVTTAADVVDAFDGQTSLREALAFANSNADASTITFASGAGEAFEHGGTVMLVSSNGHLTVASDVIIDGDLNDDGTPDITIDGQDATRLFYVDSGDVTLQGLALINGHSRGGDGGQSFQPTGGGGLGAGGAVFVNSSADLRLEDVTFGVGSGNGNQAIGGNGGVLLTSDDGSRGGGGGGGLDGFGGIAATGQNGVGQNGGLGGGPNGGAGGVAPNDGDNGGFGGGGGGGAYGGFADNGGAGGAGGFGAGGGGSGTGVQAPFANTGGAGGFGGGGGGGNTDVFPGPSGTGRGPGGFAGGNAGGPLGYSGGGGGGLGGSVFVMNGASLTIAGNVTFENGYVQGGIGGQDGTPGDGQGFGSGIFLVTNGDTAPTLTFEPGSGETQTVNDVIADQTGSGGTGLNAGEVGIVKDGAGTLILTGDNTFSGGTTVNDGTLQVDGTIGNVTVTGGTLTGDGTIGNVTVTGGTFTGDGTFGDVTLSNATLSGSGTFDSITATGGVTLAPGHSPDIITVTGNMTLTGADNVEIEIGGTDAVAPEFDQFHVGGDVDLGGATLDVTFINDFVTAPPDYAPGLHDRFQIITNDGANPVTDTFATLPEGAVFNVGSVPMTISYVGGDGNDVVLTEATETFEVTTLDDELDARDTNLATAYFNDLSLREALALANSLPDDATITFDDAFLPGGTLFLTTGDELLINSDVTIDGDIDGNGTADITISADSALGANDATSRVFNIDGGAAAAVTATLNGLVIRDGSVIGGRGGGIAVSDFSHGIDNLILSNSTVSHNTAYAGGGIDGTNANITIINSTLSGNSATAAGGLVAFVGLTMTNSTVWGNHSTGLGAGGMVVEGTVTITNSTVSGNSASGSFGGIQVQTSSLFTLTNSVVAGNDGAFGDDIGGGGAGHSIYTGGNIVGTNVFDGENDIGDTTLADVFASVVEINPDGIAGNGDEFNAGALANNGGRVQTVALNPDVSNPAIDTGTGTLPTEQSLGVDVDGDGTIEATPISVDARGFDRDVDFGNAGPAGPDLGAFEQQNESGLLVTTLQDDGDDATVTGDLAAETLDGGGLSLREALILANSGVLDGGDSANTTVITFDGNLTGGTTPGVDDGFVTLDGTQLEISSDVVINGDVDNDGFADIVIDGNDASRVFEVTAGTSTLDSLVITGGSTAGDGGGVRITGSADLTIINSSLTGNESTGSDGGAISNYSSLTLTDSTVLGNTADFQGGGIANFGTAVLTNVEVAANESLSGVGGGISNLTTLTLLNTTVADNSALQGGGVYNGDVLVATNLTLSGNEASGFGGGLFNNAASSTATLTNATVSGNYAGAQGGGLANNFATLTLTNSIVAGNDDTGSGPDVFNNSGTVVHSGLNIVGIGNDTVASDHVINAPSLEALFAQVGPNLYTGVESGLLNSNGGLVQTIALHADAANPAIDSGNAAFLTETTIDLNGDGDTADTIAIDARGFARDVDFGPAPGGPDLGALELANGQSFVVTTLTDELDSVDPNAMFADLNGGTGLSLREALVLTNQDPASADTITFAPGLIAGGSPGEIVLDDALGELQITGSVSIDGDIAGMGGTRDITLSGDSDNSGGAGYAAGDVRVLNVSQGNVSLNGLTITNGYACGCEGGGGGVLIGNSFAGSVANVTISNSVVSNSYSYVAGGGIYVDTGSSLTLTSSTVTGNGAAYSGGGIANYGTLKVTNSTISKNSANTDYGDYGGGGIYNAGVADIARSAITDNFVVDGSGYGGGPNNTGGGILNSNTLTVIDTTIDGNIATVGGGVSNGPIGGTATLIDTTVSNNFAFIGGGLATGPLGGLTLINSTVARNAATFAGGGIVTSTYSSIDVISSTVSGNFTAGDGGGVALYASSATLTNSIIAGNVANGAASDLYTAASTVNYVGGNIVGDTRYNDNTPVVQLPIALADIFDSIVSFDPDGVGPAAPFDIGELANNGGLVDTILILRNGQAYNNGDDAALPTDPLDQVGPLPFDARTLPRISDGTVDMGALEFQLAVANNDAVTTAENVLFSGNVFAAHGGLADSGDKLEVTELNGNAANVGIPIQLASGALLFLNDNGTFSYNPNGKFNFVPAAGSGAANLTATDTFTYTLIGGDTATVTVTITGIDNNDTLVDRPGIIDTLIGGVGNDQYFVSDAGDSITEGAAQGTADRVFAKASYTLNAGAFVEIMSTANHSGTAAINLAGNGNDNVIYGNAGPNRLDGGVGNDDLVGWGGNDTYVVDSASDTVQETDGAGPFAGGSDLVLTSVSYTLHMGGSIETLATTNAGATTALNLTGNEAAQHIIGNAGDNIIDGQGGADVMQGLGGNDWYLVDNAGDRVIETGGAGNRVFASASWTLTEGAVIEKLSTTSHTGTAAIDLTGNSLANNIIGNAGDNILDGKGGADILQGLDGNDWYFVDNAGDQVIETGGAGNRVFASASWTLNAGAVIDKLSTANHTGSDAIDLTGNNLGNVIYGNAGANVLNGKNGNDNLTGFGGADTFVFDTAPNNTTNLDFISDMTHGVDHIRLALSVFTALSGSPGGTLAASEFVFGTAPVAADSNDHILYNTATGLLDYDSNGNLAGGVTHIASLSSRPMLAHTDFLLG